MNLWNDTNEFPSSTFIFYIGIYSTYILSYSCLTSIPVQNENDSPFVIFSGLHLPL